MLKASFLPGRPTKDDFGARVRQSIRRHGKVMEVAVMSLSARDQQALDGIEDGLAGSTPKLAAMLATFTRLTSGEEIPAEGVTAVSADIPARPAPAPPPLGLPRHRVGNAARWAASGLVTLAILAAAFACASVPGGGRYAAVAFVIAFGYFVFWLSAGVDMLWQWSCAGLPTARMCVRCAHTVASHRTSASCAVRSGSLKVWTRCSCSGYVPPGRSPKTGLGGGPTDCSAADARRTRPLWVPGVESGGDASGGDVVHVA